MVLMRRVPGGERGVEALDNDSGGSEDGFVRMLLGSGGREPNFVPDVCQILRARKSKYSPLDERIIRAVANLEREAHGTGL